MVILAPIGWEFHIAGDGVLSDRVQRLAANSRGIAFRGVLNRSQNARMLYSAKIELDPHYLSAKPGNRVCLDDYRVLGSRHTPN